MHYLKDMDIAGLSRPGSCSHWPVGQMRCDGRTQTTTDRAASFLGFPITDPVIHEQGKRCWISSLYGMHDKSVLDLLPLARSWIHAPALKVMSQNVIEAGYDFSERAYKMTCQNQDNLPVEFILEAGQGSPLQNACVILKNWGEAEVRIKLDGKILSPGEDLLYGERATLGGMDLIVWIEKTAVKPVRITVTAQGD